MKISFNLRLLFLALASGIILWLGWPPLPLFLLLFVGFVPVLMIEHLNATHAEGSRWKLFLFSYIAFVIWNGGTTYWIYNATLPGAIFAILANALLMTVPILIYSSTKKAFGTNIGYLGLIAYWITYEYIHFQWELAWPWMAFGNGLSMFPTLIQWYEYTGIFGGSLWILFMNILVFHWLVRKLWWKEGLKWKGDNQELNPKGLIRRFSLFGGAWLFLPALISLSIYFTYEENGEAIEVVLVQPNIDPYQEKFRDGENFIPYDQQLQRLLDLSAENVTENTRYIVWPETAIPGGMDVTRLEEFPQVNKIRAFLQKHPHVLLITGIDGYQVYSSRITPTAREIDGKRWMDFYNTALQITPGEGIEYYNKSKLVPGVERMPYPQVFSFFENFAIDLGGMSGSLGTQKEREVFFSDDGIGIAPVICFESVFGEFLTKYVNNGADAIFVITNDGWWGNTPGYMQHLYFSSIRAIETRKSVARSANTGISCFINQRGDIRKATEFWVQASLKDEILVNNTKTFYTKNGDIIARLAVLLAIICLLMTIVSNLTKKFYFRST